MSAQTDLGRADLHRAAGPAWVVSTPKSDAAAPYSASRRAAAWSFPRRRMVSLTCLATLAVHLLSLSRKLGSDEGGFAMVASHWLDRGPYLYGTQWVDRPPGLIALFAAAEHLGGYGVRLTATLLAVVLVAAVASAAQIIGGSSAAKWAAWTAFAFGSSTLLAAQQLNGELGAATFVALSIAALLHALVASRTRPQTALWGTLAGGSATVAVLMKQNFLDAFVFAAVLLAGCLATRANRLSYRPSTVLSAVLGFTAGVVSPPRPPWPGHGSTVVSVRWHTPCSGSAATQPQ